MNVLERLIGNLSRLPGLGRKSASRIAYFLLRSDESISRIIAEDLASLRKAIRSCSVCGTYTDTDPCAICTDHTRNRSLICVVEEPKDVVTIESIREYTGLYHVLMGAISPIDGIGPGDLRIPSLVSRASAGGISEIIIATNPTVEGETTAMYLAKALRATGVRVSRIAFGLPVGGDLEFADKQTLARSFRGRSLL